MKSVGERGQEKTKVRGWGSWGKMGRESVATEN